MQQNSFKMYSKNQKGKTKTQKAPKKGLSPKKKYSQNWLVSPETRTKIIKKMDFLVESYPNVPILEIGPGRLDMTIELAKISQKYNRKMVAIEVDPDAVDFINQKLANPDESAEQNEIPEEARSVYEGEAKYQILSEIDFELIYGDALEILASGPKPKKTHKRSPNQDITTNNLNGENSMHNSVSPRIDSADTNPNSESLEPHETDSEWHSPKINSQKSKLEFENFIVFSSLPYSVGSRILVEVCQNYQCPFLVICQKEVGKKMLNRDLNLLGGFLSIYYNLKYHFDIAGGCFFPKPKVTSCLVEGRPKT